MKLVTWWRSEGRGKWRQDDARPWFSHTGDMSEEDGSGAGVSGEGGEVLLRHRAEMVAGIGKDVGVKILRYLELFLDPM